MATLSAPSMQEAIDLAGQAVANGNAIRYTVTQGKVEVETDQGWQTWWPEDVPYTPEQYL